MSCLFCNIAKKSIPSEIVFENENVLGFKDIHPMAKEHYLFIHKKHSLNILELSMDHQNLNEVFSGIAEFLKNSKLKDDGFRIVTNAGKNAGQSVFHTHFHLLGGEALAGFGA